MCLTAQGGLPRWWWGRKEAGAQGNSHGSGNKRSQTSFFLPWQPPSQCHHPLYCLGKMRWCHSATGTFRAACNWCMCWSCLAGARRISRGALSLLCVSTKAVSAAAVCWNCDCSGEFKKTRPKPPQTGNNGFSWTLSPYWRLPGPAMRRWSVDTGNSQKAWADLKGRCDEDLLMDLIPF